MSNVIYSYPNNPKVMMSLVVSEYNGAKVTVKDDIKMGVDNKTPEYLAKFPAGKVPAMDTPRGPLFESFAIARYVARLNTANPPNLYPTDPYEASVVDQWLDFAHCELELPFQVWIYPIFGMFPFNKVAHEKAVQDAEKALDALEFALRRKTFLVGERISLADIVMFSMLYNPFKMVLDASYQAKYVNITRWYTTLAAQPQFSRVFGEVVLCKEMQKAKEGPKEEKKEKKPKEEKPKEDKPKKEKAPKEEKKKEEKPKEEKPKKEADEEMEEDYEDKPKSKNPLDFLPPSKLVLDDWKRMYSNNDTRTVANPWFWEHYDPEGYCLYFCNYKYNNELDLTFKSANQIGGFFNRAEHLRKYAFGCMLIYGTDHNLAIGGAWLLRGKEMPPDMVNVDDYMLYDWVKVDINNAEDKKKIEDIWAWEGSFEGRSVNQGKAFK